jgi:hypothetical protein
VTLVSEHSAVGVCTFVFLGVGHSGIGLVAEIDKHASDEGGEHGGEGEGGGGGGALGHGDEMGRDVCSLTGERASCRNAFPDEGGEVAGSIPPVRTKVGGGWRVRLEWLPTRTTHKKYTNVFLDGVERWRSPSPHRGGVYLSGEVFSCK